MKDLLVLSVIALIAGTGSAQDWWKAPLVQKITDVDGDTEWTGAVALLSSKFALLGKKGGLELVDTGSGTDNYWPQQKSSLESAAESLLDEPVRFHQDNSKVLIVDKGKHCIYRLAGAGRAWPSHTSPDNQTVSFEVGVASRLALLIAIAVEFGKCGESGDSDEDLVSSTFKDPVDLCSVGKDEYLVLDQGNSKLRRVSKRNNKVTTAATLNSDVDWEGLVCYSNVAYLTGNKGEEKAELYRVTFDRTGLANLAMLMSVNVDDGADGRTNGTAKANKAFTHLVILGNQLLMIDGGKLRVFDLYSRNLTTVCKEGDTCNLGNLIGLDQHSNGAIALDDENDNLVRVSPGPGSRSYRHDPHSQPSLIDYFLYRYGKNSRWGGLARYMIRNRPNYGRRRIGQGHYHGEEGHHGHGRTSAGHRH